MTISGNMDSSHLRILRFARFARTLRGVRVVRLLRYIGSLRTGVVLGCGSGGWFWGVVGGWCWGVVLGGGWGVGGGWFGGGLGAGARRAAVEIAQDESVTEPHIRGFRFPSDTSI